MQAPSLGRKDPLEEEMATHSSVLAGKIPWTEEPGRLQIMGLQSQTLLEQLITPIAHQKSSFKDSLGALLGGSRIENLSVVQEMRV